jgi:hypothetical protein
MDIVEIYAPYVREGCRKCPRILGLIESLKEVGQIQDTVISAAMGDETGPVTSDDVVARLPHLPEDITADQANQANELLYGLLNPVNQAIHDEIGILQEGCDAQSVANNGECSSSAPAQQL